MAESTVSKAAPTAPMSRPNTFRQDTPPGPPTAAPLSALAMQQDTALEYDSMVLMSKLEQLEIRMNDTLVQASAPLSLECLVTIANHLVEFTEQLAAMVAKRFSLERLIAQDHANYAHLRPHYVRNRRFSFETFTKLHMPQGVLLHPDTFPSLTRDLLRVSNICLNICVKAFHAPEMRQQWGTVYSGFLVQVARAVKSVQTR